MFKRTVHDTLYQADVTICIGLFRDFCVFVKRRVGMDRLPFQDRRIPAAKTVEHEFTNGVKEWYVWFPHWPGKPTPGNIGSIVHECAHVSFQILRDRRVTLCAESEEAYTYHLASLFINAIEIVEASQQDRKKRRKY